MFTILGVDTAFVRLPCACPQLYCSSPDGEDAGRGGARPPGATESSEWQGEDDDPGLVGKSLPNWWWCWSGHTDQVLFCIRVFFFILIISWALSLVVHIYFILTNCRRFKSDECSEERRQTVSIKFRIWNFWPICSSSQKLWSIYGQWSQIPAPAGATSSSDASRSQHTARISVESI